MIVSFPYYVSFGKLDSVDCEIDVELTEAETKILFDSACKEKYDRLGEDEATEAIYEKVYSAIMQEQYQLLLDDESLKDELGEYLELDEKEIETYKFTIEEIEEYLTEYLSLGILYPEDLDPEEL